MSPYIIRSATGHFHATVILQPRKLDRAAAVSATRFAIEGRDFTEEGIYPGQFVCVAYARFIFWNLLHVIHLVTFYECGSLLPKTLIAAIA
jgi:hypothetical protein